MVKRTALGTHCKELHSLNKCSGFFSWNKNIYNPSVWFQGQLSKFCRNILQLLWQPKNFFIDLLLGQEILNIWKSPSKFGGNNILFPLPKIFISSFITCSTPQLSHVSPLERTSNFKHWFRPNSAQNVTWICHLTHFSRQPSISHNSPFLYTDLHTSIHVFGVIVHINQCGKLQLTINP